MNPRALPCLAVLLLAGLRVGAQTTDTPAPTPRPVLPSGPILAVMPNFAAWTITIQTIPGLHEQSADGVALSVAPAIPESITTVTKTDLVRQSPNVTKAGGQVRRSLRKLKTGQQEDIWYEYGNRISMESSWKVPMFEVATSPASKPLGPDFPELAWIAAENFIGTRHYHDADYFVFETGLSEMSDYVAKTYGYKQKTIFNRAYVNVDTRVPWLLQAGDTLHRYVFQDPPTAPLDVPPEFQAMFDTFEKKKIESAIKPVAP